MTSGEIEAQNRWMDENAVFDPIFVFFLKMYEKFVIIVNYAQRITTTTSYKLFTASLVSVLAFLFYNTAMRAYYGTLMTLNEITQKENVLRLLIANQSHLKFLDDRRIFFYQSDMYFNQEHGTFIKFLKEEFENMQFKKKLTNVTDALENLTLLVSVYPLAMNLPWWTNIFSVLIGFLKKPLLFKTELMNILFTIKMNFYLGILLPLIQFMNTFLIIGYFFWRRAE